VTVFIVIAVVIVTAVAVAVAPVPVLFLLFGVEFAEVTMLVPMVLMGQLPLIEHFVIIPDMVVAVARVIDPIGIDVRKPSPTPIAPGRRRGRVN
jgi:hypothetical protein